MESCLGELHLNWCIIYLYDIIVFSRTPEEYLHRLKAVFNKLEATGLKLKPSRGDLFKQQINYLGHVVSKEGVSTDPEKIKAVTDRLPGIIAIHDDICVFGKTREEHNSLITAYEDSK